MLFALTIALQAYSTDVLKGQILLNGEEINAEFVKLSSTTVALGTGYDACIPQYSQGRLCIPGQVKIGSTTYTITKINNMAFRFCTELTFVDIENGVTKIGNFAFQGCTGLKEVDLPSTLTSIGTGAFIDLHLLRVKCEATIPPVWEYNDVFKFHEGGISDTHTYNLGAIHLTVPKNTEESYRQALYTIPELGWTTPDGWGSLSGIGDAFYDSYHIYTPDDLNALREYCIDQQREGEKIMRVFLEDDIDMSGFTWTSGIGELDREFQGSFFGQGHTISNLTVTGDNPLNHGAGAGLFGLYGGERISNLRLKNCRFSHPNFAGALIAYATTSSDIYNDHTDIDSVYVSNCKVESNGNLGGLVGSSYTSLDIKNSYIELYNFGPYDIGVTPTSRGTVVGKGFKTKIRNCAVPIFVSNDSSYGPFVGTLQNNSKSKCDVDSCYTYEMRKTGFINAVAYDIGEHIVYTGDEWTFWRGDTQFPQRFNEQGETMTGFNLIPYLGTEKWAYKYGERPVPECFATEWEPEVNKFIVCPAGKGILNGLTPTEEIPMKAWHTDDYSLAFHNYDFTASRLWFDEKLNPDIIDRPNQLPLGTATITSTGGVEYGRVLQATDIGPHTYKEPIYDVDEQGNMVETTDSITITDGRDYKPIGYSVYLPYRLNMSPFCKLYQPQAVTTEGGVTTIHFRLLNTDYIEPFTPYYIVVEAETFPLSTEAETHFPKIGNTDINLGTYTFMGTNKSMSNLIAIRNNAYILQSDGKWHRVTANSPNVYIPAFRAFFSKNSNVASGVNEIRMIFEDDDATSIEDLNAAPNANGPIYNLAGQRLNKMQKGINIVGGKKVLIK